MLNTPKPKNSLQYPLLSGQSVLVTGGAGFIGSHLVHALLAQGKTVRILDDLSSGHHKNIPANIHFIQGSIVDQKIVEEADSNIDYVFHLAAMVSVPQSVSDPAGSFLCNVVGTENVIRACVKNKVRSLIYASSAAVYGPAPSLPSKETDPLYCVSPYAAGKAAGEMLIQSAVHSAGLQAVSLRFFNVFGVRQDPRSAYAAAISAFVDAAISKRPAIIFGTGTQTRDFVPVGNVVQALMRAAVAGPSASGKSFNVGLGKQSSLLEVLKIIAQFSEFESEPVMMSRRAGDVEHSSADISLISSALDYSPTISISEGLQELVEYNRGLLTNSGLGDLSQV